MGLLSNDSEGSYRVRWTWVSAVALMCRSALASKLPKPPMNLRILTH